MIRLSASPCARGYRQVFKITNKVVWIRFCGGTGPSTGQTNALTPFPISAVFVSPANQVSQPGCRQAHPGNERAIQTHLLKFAAQPEPSAGGGPFLSRVRKLLSRVRKPAVHRRPCDECRPLTRWKLIAALPVPRVCRGYLRTHASTHIYRYINNERAPNVQSASHAGLLG